MAVWRHAFATSGERSLPSDTSFPASAPQEWTAGRSAERSDPPPPSHSALPCGPKPDKYKQSSTSTSAQYTQFYKA